MHTSIALVYPANLSQQQPSSAVSDLAMLSALAWPPWRSAPLRAALLLLPLLLLSSYFPDDAANDAQCISNSLGNVLLSRELLELQASLNGGRRLGVTEHEAPAARDHDATSSLRVRGRADVDPPCASAAQTLDASLQESPIFGRKARRLRALQEFLQPLGVELHRASAHGARRGRASAALLHPLDHAMLVKVMVRPTGAATAHSGARAVHGVEADGALACGYLGVGRCHCCCKLHGCRNC